MIESRRKMKSGTDHKPLNHVHLEKISQLSRKLIGKSKFAVAESRHLHTHTLNPISTWGVFHPQFVFACNFFVLEPNIPNFGTFF